MSLTVVGSRWRDARGPPAAVRALPSRCVFRRVHREVRPTGSAAARPRNETRYSCVPKLADQVRGRLPPGLLKRIVSAGALMIRKQNRTALIVIPQAYCLSCEEKTPHRHERLAIRGAQVARTICLACNNERGNVAPERQPISSS